MQITSAEYEGGVLQLNLSGRLDLAGSRIVDATLNQLALKKNLLLIVNLAEVEFLASIGIRSIMMAAKTIKGRQGALVLMGPQPLVAEVLTRTSVHSLVPLCNNLETAWEAVWTTAHANKAGTA